MEAWVSVEVRPTKTSHAPELLETHRRSIEPTGTIHGGGLHTTHHFFILGEIHFGYQTNFGLSILCSQYQSG